MKNINITFIQLKDKMTDEKIKDIILRLDKLIWKENNYPYKIPKHIYFKNEFKENYNSYYYIIARIKSDVITGCIRFELEKLGDNNYECYIEPYIKPNYRKKGIFKSLIKDLLNNIPTEVNLINGHLRSDLNSSFENYLSNLGGKIVYTVRRSSTNIREFDLELVSLKAIKLKKSALDKGYNVHFAKNGDFKSLGIFSDSDYVKLIENLKNDMPKDNKIQDKKTLDVKKYMTRYDKISKLKCESYTFVITDKDSKPIAMTECWNKWESPDHARQSDTGVLFKHRGNQLGLTLKYQMLQYLLTNPDCKNVIFWSTGNASSNKHMLAINKELKYKEDGIFKIFYINKDIIVKKLENKNY